VLPRGLQPGVILGVLGGLAVVIGCLTTWANVGALGGFSHSYPETHFGEGQVTLALAAVAVFVALASTVERRLLLALPVLGGAALALTLSKRSEIAETPLGLLPRLPHRQRLRGRWSRPGDRRISAARDRGRARTPQPQTGRRD
jgi:hypothetical protein